MMLRVWGPHFENQRALEKASLTEETYYEGVLTIQTLPLQNSFSCSLLKTQQF